MKNRLTIDDLLELGARPVASADPEELMLVQEDLADQFARLRRASAALLVGLEARYRDDIKPGTGTQHIKDGDFDVRYELPKRVEWDTDKLQVIEDDSMLGAGAYIRQKLDVLESRYAAAPADIRAELDAARTVKTGTPKFMITRREK